MPILDNPKHELFAQELSRGLSATEAYERAGYTSNRHNAAALLRKEHISARVKELQAVVAEKAVWTSIERLEALKDIFEASKDEDRKTAISAIAEANKMQGSYAPSKVEASGPNGGPIPVGVVRWEVADPADTDT